MMSLPDALQSTILINTIHSARYVPPLNPSISQQYSLVMHFTHSVFILHKETAVHNDSNSPMLPRSGTYTSGFSSWPTGAVKSMLVFEADGYADTVNGGVVFFHLGGCGDGWCSLDFVVAVDGMGGEMWEVCLIENLLSFAVWLVGAF